MQKWDHDIIKMFGDKNLDVVVDNTGKSEIIERGYNLLSNEGRFILVGVPQYNDKITFNALPLFYGRTLNASNGGDGKTSEDIARYIELERKGILKLKIKLPKNLL